MKIGDSVICINSDDIWSNSRKDLTVGKEYRVIDIEYCHKSEETGDAYLIISVINDYHRSYGYYDYRFMCLKEYRKLKLKKLSDAIM